MQAVLSRGKSGPASYAAVPIPSNKIEYAFYFVMLYSITADILGISVSMLAGGLFFLLCGMCLLQIGSSARLIYAPIGLLIGCVTSFFVIQYVVHDISILDGSLRPFLIWVPQLLIVYWLSLRPGFSIRYPFVLFIIAILTLPFLTFSPGEVERARVDVELGVGGGLSHPGGLAEWFGFFAVFFAVLGLDVERVLYRLIAWIIAAGCIFVLALTVSRSVLFASALAITVGFRSILKRGFIPALLLIALVGGIFASGLFDIVISSYTERGMEETGRERLWPAVVERIFATELTPFIGVGESKSGTYALSAKNETPPHNTFLHFALSSGMIPVAFFLAFWVQAAWKSVANTKGGEAASFRMPYLVYSFTELMFGDWSYMSAWGLLTVSIAAGSVVKYGKQRFVIVRLGNKMRLGLFPPDRSPEPNRISGRKPGSTF